MDSITDAKQRIAAALRVSLGLAGEKAMPSADSAAIQTDWQTWLRACGPRTFTGTFAPFHSEFWEWNWRLTWKIVKGEPIAEEELAFLALWFRGAGKSSHVEWAAIAEGALVGSGYVLYVSGTQALAEGHVSAIRERLESEEVARYYPHLANPQIGRHGNQFGWRQDFLRTEGGWAIRPVGLDVGVRGGRVGDLRPTLIIFDDIDDHKDSPHVVETKESKIARSIMPAGTSRTRMLFAQNLIHRNSVANRIYTRKSGILAKRIVSGPFRAFEGLQVEMRQTQDGPRDVITAGAPTWPDIDLQACQKFLDDSGRAAFLSEYQHDFSEIEQGRVIPEYDEALHVITWSQFERVFGARHIPAHWQREVGHDVGFTRDHLSAWVWIATSAANAPLPGLRFRYRGMTFCATQVDDQAEAVKLAMDVDFVARRLFDEFPLIGRWRMSHEALSERQTYNVKHDLPFERCLSGKTAGVSEWRHYLRTDKTIPHPFKDDIKLADGSYKLGCPAWFDVVDDDQLTTPRDDRGLKLFREQALSWRWKPTPLTERGMVADEPVKANDDCNDATRMVTAEWGPDVEPMTREEEIEKRLPENLRLDAIKNLLPSEGWQMSRARAYRHVEAEMEEDEMSEFERLVRDMA
jgi:hypothetical protein